MNCPSCRQELAEEAKFCISCGTPITRIDAATQIDVPHITNGRSQKHDSRIGLILDSKYQLIEHLGEGGMGSVYRARRLHIGDEVAVKLLHPDLVREEQALERFRREARSAAMISHQNVVSIHDFSDAGGENANAYIVMELVKGVSLATLLRREGRMSPTRAVALMHDICAGVGVAHRQGLLHRDLKPDNVIITPADHEGESESAKVVDFGLAKVRDVANATALTQTGAVIGTLYYMSPEQCGGDELDPRADVYSLGAMLYEMLSGGPPFRSNNVTGLIAKHLNEPPPAFPVSLNIPPSLATVCFKALSKNREDRQPNAVALGRELDAALRPPPEKSSARSWAPTVRIKPESPSSGRTLKWVIVAAGGFILLTVIGGVFFAVIYGWNQLRSSEKSNQATNQNVVVPATTKSAQARPSEATSDGSIPVSTQGALTGAWTGTYGPLGQPAKLMIKSQSGNQLSGELEQGAIRVAFSGTFDAVARTVSMKQSEVVDGDASSWVLGEDRGSVSADGRQMSGTGKDPVGGALGLTYQWSFTRSSKD